jgi:hypothetical protein
MVNRLYKKLTKNEEVMLWKDTMQVWRDHPKWFLENFERLPEYKVSWNNYSRVRIQCSECLEFNYPRVEICKYCQSPLKNKKTHTFGVGIPPKRAQKV